MKRIWLALTVFLGMAAQAVPAFADIQATYNLNVDSNFSSGNFGTITLLQKTGNTTDVIVTVQLNTASPGVTFANSNAGYAIAWDIKNSSTSPLTSVTIDTVNTPHSGSFAVQPFNGSYKASPFTSGSNGNPYQYAIEYGGATGTDSKLVFDVNRSTGLTLSDFIPNPNWLFAVDIAIQGNTRNVSVPEPATWLIFFAGLAGLTFMMQRRRKLARAA